MKKAILVMAMACLMGFVGCGNTEVQTAETVDDTAMVECAEECADVVTEPTKRADKPKGAEECDHEWISECYWTDWGFYDGRTCVKCGEGEFWLVDEEECEDDEEPTEEVIDEVVEEPTEEVEESYYDWETYEKPNADKPGFNSGEVETDHLYNEEYFYNDYYDHSNVDLVYDEEIANSYPPYGEQ